MAGFCPNCGGPTNGNKFCTLCGTKLEAAPEGMPVSEAVTEGKMEETPVQCTGEEEKVTADAEAVCMECPTEEVSEEKPVVPEESILREEPQVQTPVQSGGQPFVQSVPQQPTAQPVQQMPQQPPVQPMPQSVPQPVPARPVNPVDAAPKQGSAYEPISTGGYIGIFLLMGVPLVGFIFTIVWACGGCRKISKRNLSRAALILMLIGIIITAVCAVVGYIFTDMVIDALYNLV